LAMIHYLLSIATYTEGLVARVFICEIETRARLQVLK
jgi:hypothetical protein